jgi:cytidine deaminase
MTVDQLTGERLIEAARMARDHAYAPYSRFAVGAAVLAGSGRVFSGANVENASYGLTTCAERVAIFTAIAAGERRIDAVAVVTGASSPTPPCGACRQVIAEFGPAATILVAGGAGAPLVWSANDLLPHAFGPASLETPVASGDQAD